MELDGTRLGVFSAEKMHLNLNSGAMSLSEIMTRLLKITHRYCCERFHIETFFFLGSVQLLMNESSTEEEDTNNVYILHGHNLEPLVHD